MLNGLSETPFYHLELLSPNSLFIKTALFLGPGHTRKWQSNTHPPGDMTIQTAIL